MRKNVFWPLLLILVGVAIIFGTANIVPQFNFWHCSVAIFGIALLIGNRRFSFAGLLISVIGIYWVLTDFIVLPKLEPAYIGAAVLIILGISLLFRKKPTEREQGDIKVLNAVDCGDIDVNIVFGSEAYKYTGCGYINGRVKTVFGGTEIDLSEATPAGNELALNVKSIFGGTEITIPANWQVDRKDCGGVFGGVEVQQRPAGPADVTLHLSGKAVFGGIEVKYKAIGD